LAPLQRWQALVQYIVAEMFAANLKKRTKITAPPPFVAA
jgi:hypothetical protein